MATETVVYVSLALVLLTRIYVFINPPEFLEEHKDRRTYHEYHLYRQYHLHKQYDKNEHGDADSSTRRRSPSSEERSEYFNTSLLEGLHHPSDELVLLGRDHGTQPFPLHELSAQDISKLDPIMDSLSSSNLSPSTPLSPQQESQREVWDRMLGSNAADPVPNYISLDISEIDYNGSLEKFDQDPEVLESIRDLKAGQRDMDKECPTMTMIWEGGRWCCLEGRTLYILRALEWKGQVRVRVLVDKDPMLLAVTEDYWKASGMAMAAGENMKAGTPSTIESHASTTIDPRIDMNVVVAEASISIDQPAQMSIAAVDTGVTTVGLSLDDSGRPGSNTIETIKSAMSPKARFRLLTEDGPSLPGSPGGHDADDEREQDEVESDGYLEDDEGDEDDFDIQQRLRAMSVSKLAIPPPSKQHRYQKLAAMGTKRPLYLQEHLKDDNASEPTMVAPPSPLLLPNTGRELDPEPDMAGSIYPHVQLSPPNRLARKAPFGSIGEDGLRNNRPLQQQRQFPHQQPRTKLQHPLYHHHHHHRSLHHERKISIPEFMLPPPLHTEQTYVIIDPSAGGCERNPPRRDSGHCDSS